MVQVVWTKQALSDLIRIGDYLNGLNPQAAQRVSLGLKQAVATLASFPDRGRRLGRDRRELAHVRPYLIRYRLKGETVEILTIRHGARRPL